MGDEIGELICLLTRRYPRPMHDFNLKMIKVMLVAVMASIIFGMVSGIGALRNNYYWRVPFFAMQVDFLLEELAYIRYEYGSVSAWLKAPKEKRPIRMDGTSLAASVPVLLYHGLYDDSKWQPDGVNMRLSDFRAQMFALKHAGYQTITLDEYQAFMAGKKRLPAKSVMLTFDDGRKDSYYPVDPIFRVLGYSAVMNVITGRSLAPDNEKSSFHLSQTELMKLSESGRWEMASHTKNAHGYEPVDAANGQGHALSSKRWLAPEKRLETDAEYADRVARDLAESKLDIGKYLGARITAFAYPFGDFGQESANYPGSTSALSGILRKLYPITFYQTRGSEFINNYPGDPFMTRRIDMKSEVGVSAEMSAERLVGLLANNEEKLIGYTDDFTKDNGWLRGWGELKIGDGSMVLSDSETDDSSMAFLGGSYLWRDYFFQSQVALPHGGAFALSARYKDENNHLTCDFTENHVTFTQQVDGQNKLEAEAASLTRLGSGRTAAAGIAVFGSRAGCFLDGRLIVSGTIESSLASGGIGFKMWDTGQRGSSLVVKELRVSGDDPSRIGSR